MRLYVMSSQSWQEDSLLLDLPLLQAPRRLSPSSRRAMFPRITPPRTPPLLPFRTGSLPSYLLATYLWLTYWTASPFRPSPNISALIPLPHTALSPFTNRLHFPHGFCLSSPPVPSHPYFTLVILSPNPSSPSIPLPYHSDTLHPFSLSLSLFLLCFN
jgi:hypothetical protein